LENHEMPSNHLKTLFTDIPGWGRILITAAVFGIIRIQLEPTGTVQQLFPFMITPDDNHPITSQDEIHWQALQQIQQYLAGERQRFDLPIGILISGRQKTVLDLVCTIPYGQTLTYSQMAQKAGLSDTQKQIPAILKLNPTPLLIPSHRVVKDSQDIGGYVWGRKMKLRLLELEAKHCRNQSSHPEAKS
jgi:O-6-methylguanine DNA methyltransferase